MANNDADGLRQLRALLTQRPQSIGSASLLSMFGLRDDPCERSDTSLKDGVLTNTAGGQSSCSLKSPIPDLKVNVEVDVPLFLEGTYEHGQESFSASFPENEHRAALRITPLNENIPDHVETARLLNADWGGEIKHVFADRGYVGFSVGEESCVRAKID